jgi:hypothetical protein
MAESKFYLGLDKCRTMRHLSREDILDLGSSQTAQCGPSHVATLDQRQANTRAHDANFGEHASEGLGRAGLSKGEGAQGATVLAQETVK